MLNFLSASLEFLGTILIGVTILKVHTRVSKEHKIDKRVIDSIKKEKLLTILGLILITLGYLANFI